MGVLFVYLSYFIVVLSVVFAVGKVAGFWGTGEKKETDRSYKIGPRGNVNDIENHGEKTIQVMNVGAGYLAFVLKQDEFWYSVVEERTEKAAIFNTEQNAKTVAAQLLATEGLPVVLKNHNNENTESGSLSNPENADSDNYLNTKQRVKQ